MIVACPDPSPSIVIEPFVIVSWLALESSSSPLTVAVVLVEAVNVTCPMRPLPWRKIHSPATWPAAVSNDAVSCFCKLPEATFPVGESFSAM